MDGRDDLGLGADQALELVHLQLAVVVDGDDAELGPGLLADDLPRHDVGVVLHRRDQHLVAGGEARAGEALRHEVDPLGGAAHEDDLAVLPRADEAADLAARALVLLRRGLAQGVDAAVDVGVEGGVVAGERVDHGLRLLRRSRVVEIDERPPVHLLLQDGEVGADALHVEHGRGLGGRVVGHGHEAAPLAGFEPRPSSRRRRRVR